MGLYARYKFFKLHFFLSKKARWADVVSRTAGLPLGMPVLHASQVQVLAAPLPISATVPEEVADDGTSTSVPATMWQTRWSSWLLVPEQPSPKCCSYLVIELADGGSLSHSVFQIYK